MSLSSRCYSFPFLLFLMLFFLSTMAYSFRQHQLSTNEGLSHNAINTIYQDQQGFVWIGTKKGLNRYNGHDFQTFLPEPGDSTTLSDEDIYCLYEDQNGVLWIGTYAGGLNAYHKYTGEFDHYMYKPGDSLSINSNDVRCIQPGPGGKLWVGTWGGGVNIFDKKSQTFQHFRKQNSGLSSNNIKCFLKDPNGRMWIGTWGGGLNLFDPNQHQFRNFQDTLENRPDNITAIARDRFYSQWLWVASWGEGLYRFHRSKHTYQKINTGLPTDLLMSIRQDEKGRLWVGTEEDGLYLLTPRQDSALRYQNMKISRLNVGEAAHIKTISVDRAGTFWIGTVGHGAHAFHPPKGRFQHVQKEAYNGLNNNQVMALAEGSSNNLLIGTYGGGLNIWDRQSNTFRYVTTQEGLSSNNLWTLLQDEEGFVWLGSWGGGLNRLDLKSGQVTQYEVNGDGSGTNTNDIRYIFQVSRDYIWLGTWGGGLNRYNKSTHTFTYFTAQPGDTNSISSNNIWSIVEDNQHRLWIGTWGGGLNVYDPADQHFDHFTHQPGDSTTLSDNYIYCMYYQPRKDVIWVGTSNGLNQFNLTTRTFQRFYKKDGLASNIIASIEEGNRGYLWISTSKGISRLDQSLLKKRSDNPEISIFKNYTPSDGLQANEFNQNASFRDKEEGRLFFGGVNGLNVFHPEQVLGNTRVPPIVITALKKYGDRVQLDTPITHTKHLVLSYQDNFFTLEFAALNYIQPDQNRYSYKLEGFDKQWKYAGPLNVASYTNIPGGEYTFKVKGSNNDGVWNEQGAKLKITVVPPFWKTNTFYVLSALFILLVFYTVYRLRLRSLRKTKQTLEKQVKERTAHIREQKNKIESINQDLTNSINYAKRIQEAILPPDSEINQYFSDSFILFFPRDVVSGDFYWAAPIDNHVIFTVADCTGHGVPGAFMSMIGNDLLNHVVMEGQETQPEKILQQIDQGVAQALRQRGDTEEMKDGMDIALCSWQPERNELLFAGAHNPLYLVREGKLKEYKGDPYPIGGYYAEKTFSQQSVELQSGDQLYLFSDGYPDQFGGPKGKKFMYKRFKNVLCEIHKKDMKEQKKYLKTTLKDWMAENDEQQIDDICVMGVRVG